MRNFIKLASDVGLASAGAVGGSAMAGEVGAALAAPGWLVALGQAAVVAISILYGVDRRMSRLHKAVNETRGEVETLTGRVNTLACQGQACRTPPPRLVVDE